MRNVHGDPIKLSVFVGSPKKGLEKIRELLIGAVLDAGHIPDGMELWAADSRPTKNTIIEKLALCDVHVVVLGATYGSIMESEGVSFTEWEYQQSKKASRPVISFLLDEKAVPSTRKKPRSQRRESAKYKRFREELRSNSVCKIYSSLRMQRIERDVLNSLNEVIDNKQLGAFAGWVRAESEAARLAGALQDNQFLMPILNRVVGFQTTGSRLETEPIAKKAAAELFWDAKMSQLSQEGYKNIFLESGSSLTYVSTELQARSQRSQGWKVCTNNALALLQLMLFADGEITRKPAVAPNPQDPYGAIFTRKCHEAYEEPPISPRPLSKKEGEAMREIVKLLKAGNHKQILLGTASGWDTTHRIHTFRGPHVGSHANMLFKRAMFQTGQPIVLFLSRHKVLPAFREARFKCRSDNKDRLPGSRCCYPVFGEELTMEKALGKTPVALCVGYEREKTDGETSILKIEQQLKTVLRPHLEKAGFDMDYAGKEFAKDGEWISGAFMVANKAFRNLFPR